MKVLIINRGSGSSNTTKTISTDTSSRHSNVSTAASSADFSSHHEEQKIPHRKPVGDGPGGHHGPKSSGGFLKAAGRSFSFGGQKKPLPVVPNLDEPLPPPPVPPHSDEFGGVGRARAATASTSTTVTPPKLESDFSLDLGGDFGKMFGFDKRASVMTIRGNEPNGRQSLGPRSLTGNRLNQPAASIPAPIQIDKTSKVDPSPHSWGSQHSNENLLTHSPVQASPITENAPAAVPRQPSPLSGRPLRPGTSPETRKLSGFFGKRASPAPAAEDEDAKLLKETLSTVSKFMAGSGAVDAVSKPKAGSRYRRDEDTLTTSEAKTHDIQLDDEIGDDNLFDNSLAHSSRAAHRFVSRKPSPPPRTKVMTPAQFERYRQDKERQSAAPDAEKPEDKSDEEEIDYDDDEDEIEKQKQQAKQRRKQEAHMAVYRQQMMKVTGESNGGVAPSRPSLQMSFSTPNLPNMVDSNPAGDSDEDEEVPLAILAAHGFPNKARPPTRLSTMMSNPNLRASAQPSYQRPGSVTGDAPAAGNGRLPAFARKLPQDPFVGAGLVHNPIRESIALGGGAPAHGHPGPVPPGGLVGVIVNEERSRAMRRGSPHVDPRHPIPGPAYDPVHGIPPQMMYQNRPMSTMMTPGDQAQMQMTQQMQQFMQMQMQFMQMMSGQNGNVGMGPNGMNPAAVNNMMPMMGAMAGPDMRHSYMGGNGSVVDLPRPESHNRSMSMVQPSSASWIQPPPPQINPGFAPSIHIQGVGYAPSIAPSERSNVGLPGRYRPVSHMPAAAGAELPRSSTMSGALGNWDKQPSPTVSVTPVSGGRKSGSGNASEDDDEEGWQAMKEKREKKRSIWKSKKSFGADIGALIN